MKVGLLIALVFLTLAVGTGAVLLWSGFTSLKRAMDAENWPTTFAQVKRVELKEETDSENSRTYAVEVEYTYQVGGHTYNGNTLNDGYSGSSGYEQHRKLFEKIRSAKTLEVRFNPEKPQESSIAYGLSRSHYISLSFSITWSLGIIGFIAIFLAFQSSDDRLLSRIKVIEQVSTSGTP